MADPINALPHYDDGPADSSAARRPYYTKLDPPQATDALLRCKDCRRLVPHATIVRLGMCPGCGTRTFKEIRGLSLWEWLRIRFGWLDFPCRKQFLEEFGRGR